MAFSVHQKLNDCFDVTAGIDKGTSSPCSVVYCYVTNIWHGDWSPRGVWQPRFAGDIYSSADEIQQKTNGLVRTAKQ